MVSKIRIKPSGWNGTKKENEVMTTSPIDPNTVASSFIASSKHILNLSLSKFVSNLIVNTHDLITRFTQPSFH